MEVIKSFARSLETEEGLWATRHVYTTELRRNVWVSLTLDEHSETFVRHLKKAKERKGEGGNTNEMSQYFVIYRNIRKVCEGFVPPWAPFMDPNVPAEKGPLMAQGDPRIPRIPPSLRHWSTTNLSRKPAVSYWTFPVQQRQQWRQYNILYKMWKIMERVLISQTWLLTDL